MFAVLGATLIISSNDLISIYISLELQSFALYIIAGIYTKSLSSTSSSLKYFLLGALSSSFILLGISFIYEDFATTNLQDVCAAIDGIGLTLHSISVGPLGTLGLLFILCGFIFKVSAVPFHSWAPDVYQGVPNHIAIILISLPKISLFMYLCTILSYMANSYSTIILIIIALLSLIVGTIGGLRQIKIRRLLAFSTMSHVGFILLSLSQPITTMAYEQITSIIFYIIQYSFTTVLVFLCLMMFDSLSKSSTNYLVDLQGRGVQFTILSVTFILCLFSIAGIPPLTGFYAKLLVLKSSINIDMTFVYLIAIVCSVISASYYLKLIKIIMFDQPIFRLGAYIPVDSGAVTSAHWPSHSPSRGRRGQGG